jgi:tRNA (guanine-N7-)-methyltransferase
VLRPRTYKLRRGRVTASQAAAIERLRPVYGVEVDGRPLDLHAVFGRRAPVVLEIGFGMGEVTAAMATREPGRNLLAVDVHTPGIGNLLKLVEAGGLANVRVAEGDAVVLLDAMLGPGSLAEVRAFFPDPWPKARHVKRRLVVPDFCDLVASRLVPAGRLHLATDWPEYAEQMRAVLAAHPAFELSQEVPWRPRTRFERQGMAAGRPAHDVVAMRIP